MYVRSMELGAVLDGIAQMRAGYDAACAAGLDTLTHPELLTVLGDLEVLRRQLPVLEHAAISRLDREATPRELGAKSLKAVLMTRLRISGTDAKRRLKDAAELGPRVGLTGEPLQPVLAEVAEAQADGAINAEHVAIIRKFFKQLPYRVDPEVRDRAQTTLVTIARGHGPDELRDDAARLATAIDQDGPEPDDADRARKRAITLGPQDEHGMSRLTGQLDPQGRATVEAWQAKLAAPGMCNPDDEHPCTSGTPSQEQIDGDRRSFGQRTHDAFTAMGRSVLSSGELGQLNGLPATIIVSTTLQDLESGRGSGVTAGGTLLPMSDVIRLATHAHHFLAVFDKHTSEPLYLGRTKRLASKGQRIVLLARDRGCTFPGCRVPGYGCQAHHTTGWQHGGDTNITKLVLACGGDNRLAEDGWTVTIRNGIAEWIPPPQLDTGQHRINYYHHPERLLAPDDDDGT